LTVYNFQALKWIIEIRRRGGSLPTTFLQWVCRHDLPLLLHVEYRLVSRLLRSHQENNNKNFQNNIFHLTFSPTREHRKSFIKCWKPVLSISHFKELILKSLKFHKSNKVWSSQSDEHSMKFPEHFFPLQFF